MAGVQAVGGEKAQMPLCAASSGACPPAPPARARRLLACSALLASSREGERPWPAAVQVLKAGELLALTRHLRPRLVPGEAAPAPEVAERIVGMSAAELQELVRRLRERLAPEPAEA